MAAEQENEPKSTKKAVFPYYDSTYNFSVLIIRNKGGKYCSVDERKNRGWWLPAGYVDPGDSFYEAGLRETDEEAGLKAKIVGFLRFEHSPRFKFGGSRNSASGRMRAVFYGEPFDPNNEKVKTWAEKDSESNGAEWFSVSEFSNIKQTIAKKMISLANEIVALKDANNKGKNDKKIAEIESEIKHLNEPGCAKRRGNELLHWGSYIDCGLSIFPNSLFDCFDGYLNNGNNSNNNGNKIESNINVNSNYFAADSNESKSKDNDSKNDTNNANNANNASNSGNESKIAENATANENENETKEDSNDNNNHLRLKLLKYHSLKDEQYSRNVGCPIYYYMNVIIKNNKNEYLLLKTSNNSSYEMIESEIRLNEIFDNKYFSKSASFSDAEHVVSQTEMYDEIMDPDSGLSPSEIENDIFQTYYQIKYATAVPWNYKNVSQNLVNAIVCNKLNITNNSNNNKLIKIKGILQIQHFEMNGIAGAMNVVWYAEWQSNISDNSNNNNNLAWIDSKSFLSDKNEISIDDRTLRWIKYLEIEDGFIYPCNVITQEGERVSTVASNLSNHISDIKCHKIDANNLQRYGLFSYPAVGN